MSSKPASPSSTAYQRWGAPFLIIFVFMLAAIPAAFSGLPGTTAHSVVPHQSGAASHYLIPTELANQLPHVATVLHRYKDRLLVSVPEGRLYPKLRSRSSRLADPGRISYRGWSDNVSEATPEALEAAGDGYYLLGLIGPLDPTWREELRSGGLQVVDTASPHGLLVRGDHYMVEQLSRSLVTSEGQAVIRHALPLPEQTRTAPDVAAWISGRAEPAGLGMRTEGGRALVRVELHADADPDDLHPRILAILQRGPEFIRGRRAAQFRADAPGIARLLEEVPEVAFVHGEYPRETRANLAAKDYIVNVEPVWSDPGLGYTGLGVIAGVNDSGMDRTHNDFPAGTIVDTIGAMETSGGGGILGPPGDAHGTHVTGTILGRGAAPSPTNTSGCGDQTTPLPDARGMAWEAQVTHNNLFDGGINSIPDMMEWHAERGAVLNNNSWGYQNTYSYNASTAEVDVAVRDAIPSDPGNIEHTIVFAAGNDGPGSETIGTPGNAKNAITVGASQNDRCGEYIGSNPDINAMAPFSGRGPAQGRIKPDVVAPGTDVLSTESEFDPECSGWDGEWTGDQYCTSPGTSMASPVVAGAATLFYQHYNETFGGWPSPALVRAVLINTATDMGFGFPSMDQGWGRINARKAIEGPAGGEIVYIDQDEVDHLSTGQDWNIDIAVADGVPFKVSVVWTDPPGSAGCSDCLVNDLDLIVTAPDGTVYRGNQFAGAWSEANPSERDDVNNVENVYVENPEPGTWNVEVTSVNTATNPPGLSGQDFAVVMSGQLEEGEGFRLSTDPDQISICAGDDAVYDIGVRSLGGFDDAVALAVTDGLPGGASATFNPDPVTPADPAAISQLTISDTGGVSSDTYSLVITGQSSGPNFDSESDTVSVSMTVTGQAPGTGGLLAPTDGASGVSTQPEFSWQSFPDAVEYTIEVASDASFNNIVISETVTNTSFQSVGALHPGEEYFWRVQASNGCGDGDVSETFSFTTVEEICSAPGSTIPSGGSVSDTINVDTSGTVEGLKVSVDLQFDWVGDLVVTLEHVASGTSIDLINRPGTNSSQFGCDAADIDALFDDAAAQLGNDMCNSSPPAIDGEIQPLGALTDFEGELIEGDWILTVTDEEGYEDAGTLNQWCLLPDTETVAFPIIAVDPEAIEAELSAGTQTIEALDIFNLGDATLEWSVNTAEAMVLTDSQGSGSVGPGTGSGLPETALALSDLTYRPAASNVIAPAQTFDCNNAEGLIIHDDGNIDNGYSGNPESVDSVTLVEGFTPAEPGTLGTVCISFLSTGPASVDFELVVFDDDGVGGAPGTELTALSARAEDLPQGIPAQPVWYTVDLSAKNIQVESGTVYIGARWAVFGEEFEDPNVFIASDEEGPGPGVGYFRADSGAWDELGADVFDNYQALFVRPQLTSGGCMDPTAIDWLDVIPTFGTTGPSASSDLDVFVDSDGLAEGTYEALLCVNSNDPANSQVEIPVSLVVSAAEATQLVFGTQPSTTEVGVSMEPMVTVEVQDASGEILTSDNDTVVELSLTGGASGAGLSGTTSIQVVEGVAAFSDLSVDAAGFDYRLAANDGATELDGDTSAPFDITQANSTTAITQIDPPDEQTVNEPYTVTVHVDGFNPSGTVTVADGAGATCQITLPDDSCQLASDVSGPKTITADYSGDANNADSMDDANYEIIESDSTTTITTIDPPTEQTVGESYLVTAEVTGDNPTGTVAVGDGDGASCQITLNGGSGSCALTSTSVGSKTLTASYGGDDDNAPSQDQTGYEIVQADSTVEITQIDPASEQTVHESYTVMVSVDGYDPTGTVTVDDGDGSDCLMTLSGGVGSCALASTGVGSKTITASYAGDANNNADSDTTGYLIVADVPDHLAFAVEPGDAISQATMDEVVVHVRDEHGNRVDWDDDTEVSLSLLGGDAQAELAGGGEITVSAGVATFDALSIDLVGSDYQLEAHASGLAEALSVEFKVFHGDPESLAFIDQPTTTQVNATITPAVTVAVLDAVGNLADTDNDTEVELSLTGGDPAAILSGTTSAIVSEGMATFADLSVDTAGESYQLNAVDSEQALDGASSALFDIGSAAATVSLTDLTQTYTGDPLAVTVTTDPEGLSYEVTYDGSTDEPSGAGSYEVVATITEPGYEGSASDTFVIDPAPAALALSDLEQTWDGDPKPVTVTPDPAEVSYSVTYGSSSEAPSEVGDYAVVATITDDNYTGDDATGMLVISEASSETSIVGISPAGSQTVGESYSVTVSVIGNSPTGTVAVGDGENNSCQITLPADNCELDSTSVGVRTITAEYSGDDHHGPSYDQAVYEITPAEPGLVIQSVDPADWQVAGLPYTVEIAIEGFEPSGTVTVDDGHGEICEIALPATSCELTSFEVGETMLTAHYPGDDNNEPDQAQATYEIEASGPVALLFSTEPANTVVDMPISPAIVVHVLDSTGELVEDDHDTFVTIELETNPHGAELSGTLSVQVSGGIAVFDDLAIDTIGAGYRLRAADDEGELDATVTELFEVFEGGILHDRFESADD